MSFRARRRRAFGAGLRTPVPAGMRRYLVYVGGEAEDYPPSVVIATTKRKAEAYVRRRTRRGVPVLAEVDKE